MIKRKTNTTPMKQKYFKVNLKKEPELRLRCQLSPIGVAYLATAKLGMSFKDAAVSMWERPSSTNIEIWPPEHFLPPLHSIPPYYTSPAGSD